MLVTLRDELVYETVQAWKLAGIEGKLYQAQPSSRGVAYVFDGAATTRQASPIGTRTNTRSVVPIFVRTEDLEIEVCPSICFEQPRELEPAKVQPGSLAAKIAERYARLHGDE
jgi:hypothetical protein